MRRSVIWRPNLSARGMISIQQQKRPNPWLDLGDTPSPPFSRARHSPFQTREARAFPPEPSALELPGLRLRAVGFLSVRPRRSENLVPSLYAAREQKQIVEPRRM